jgi:hypothetical protein
MAAFMVGLLIGPDFETGLLVGAGDLIGAHLDRLERLADYRLDRVLAAQIRDWCKVVRNDLVPERNLVLHGAWLFEDPELYKMVRRRKGAAKREEFTVERLTRVRDLAESLRNEALLLAREIDMAPKWAVWLREPRRPRPRWEEPLPDPLEPLLGSEDRSADVPQTTTTGQTPSDVKEQSEASPPADSSEGAPEQGG